MIYSRVFSARCCVCTCTQKYARWSISASHARKASTASTAAYEDDLQYSEEYQPGQQDFHDQRVARQLTARLQKTKKRIVKRGQDFVDKIYVSVEAGKGGDGAVAFHTEKFVPRGPPSGGNGGQGGNVYIRPVTNLSSLSGLTKRMRAHNGQPGQGSWMHGKRGDDLVIEVPYGTVVRERRGFSPEEAAEEEEVLSESMNDFRRRIKREAKLEPEEYNKRRRKLFSLYPTLANSDDFLDNKQIQELELSMLEEERRVHHQRLTRPPLELDLVKPPEEAAASPTSDVIDAKKVEDAKMLLLKGGQGGYGNPYFTSTTLRNPKFATRGRAGESMRLEFELKTLADIGLVGLPNAGKSTLLRALTNSRSVVASYAFTTLSPQIGTLIVYDDSTYSTTSARGAIEETSTPTTTEQQSPSNESRQRLARPAHKEARQEKFRLTVADCPGLLAKASENVGLGHDFLRHIERSKILIYVVDLSSRSPAKDLRVLREELEAYKPGLSERAKVVVANKADLASEGDPDSVAMMKTKLAMLRDLVTEWQGMDGVQRTVIPMSARLRGNVQTVVDCLVDAMPN